MRFLIVEDHGLVREGLAKVLLGFEDGSEVVEAADFEQAQSLLEEREDFDLVLLDIALPGKDGISGLSILRQDYPFLTVAMLSAYDDSLTVNRVINLGAAGFIPKAFSSEQLLVAVERILDGEIFRPDSTHTSISEREATMMPNAVHMQPAEIGLTERQAQVLSLMVRGMSNREIGEQLSLSEGTVKIHATAVFKALGVSSRSQALVAVNRYRIDFGDVF